MNSGDTLDRLLAWLVFLVIIVLIAWFVGGSILWIADKVFP